MKLSYSLSPLIHRQANTNRLWQEAERGTDTSGKRRAQKCILNIYTFTWYCDDKAVYRQIKQIKMMRACVFSLLCSEHMRFVIFSQKRKSQRNGSGKIRRQVLTRRLNGEIQPAFQNVDFNRTARKREKTQRKKRNARTRVLYKCECQQEGARNHFSKVSIQKKLRAT